MLLLIAASRSHATSRFLPATYPRHAAPKVPRHSVLHTTVSGKTRAGLVSDTGTRHLGPALAPVTVCARAPRRETGVVQDRQGSIARSGPLADRAL